MCKDFIPSLSAQELKSNNGKENPPAKDLQDFYLAFGSQSRVPNEANSILSSPSDLLSFGSMELHPAASSPTTFRVCDIGSIHGSSSLSQTELVFSDGIHGSRRLPRLASSGIDTDDGRCNFFFLSSLPFKALCFESQFYKYLTSSLFKSTAVIPDLLPPLHAA
ncbi:hypothetical protein KSP40_PGU001826 [Platanthera guangdongensis]|uniref:Uncharacterized protein n=1 Tax=Platanthera guangdongensis TaxID=2320717 RepID=A0ABR2MR58_9ASPA